MKNKEIEELLNNIKDKYSYDPYDTTGKVYTTISYEEGQLLLSYIEQLEQCYCNRTDCSSRIKDSKKYDSLLQKYEQLEKENEFLKLDNPSANMKHFEMLKENKRKIDNLRYQKKQLENNRDKAIEYIEEKGRLKYNPNELIDILKR